ncbi:hypothetical protein [Cellulomonas edaphi]|uniref:Mucin-associated surface protein n=1 Tax=Cellulomonas edaphi TaxID=3053468 RepID=A0ABT7S680_9CELL|nr:hypothetical protein [Cellulomons edaphi]MDM7831122.1 hypothetical protein [Cellulomons edaphi]
MRRPTLVGGLVACVLVLGACGGQTDLEGDRAHALQQDVLAVSTAAAAEKWDAVGAGLAAARAELDAALDAGDVSPARYHRIDAALDRVAAEVATARARAAVVAKAKATARAEATAQARAKASANAKATGAATAPPPTTTKTSGPAVKAPTPAQPSTKGKGANNGKGHGAKHPPRPKKDK